MSARDDMHRHFTAISPVYRSVRTTDREPVEWIARELNGLARPKGADIGCGAGRYVLSMFEMIPNLSLTCVDTTPAMLEQVDGLLRANGFDGFETRQSTAECLELEPGGFDFVSSFNAVHHFDFPQFLRRSRDGLAKDGRLFVYTRLPEHNARSIWGRYFPGFTERETRLLALGELAPGGLLGREPPFCGAPAQTFGTVRAWPPPALPPGCGALLPGHEGLGGSQRASRGPTESGGGSHVMLMRARHGFSGRAAPPSGEASNTL